MRILIHPLTDQPRFALTNLEVIIAQSQGEAEDRAEALENAFQALVPQLKNPTEIVVINGPGNFTAIRTGIGFARGLGVAYGVPTRGISVFELDYARFQSPPKNAVLYRDARGGRFYQAEFMDGRLVSIKLTDKLLGGYSAETIEGTQPIPTHSDDLMMAFAQIAQTDQGKIPARANYVRPPDAALPKSPPMVILDG